MEGETQSLRCIHFWGEMTAVCMTYCHPWVKQLHDVKRRANCGTNFSKELIWTTSMSDRYVISDSSLQSTIAFPWLAHSHLVLISSVCWYLRLWGYAFVVFVWLLVTLYKKLWKVLIKFPGKVRNDSSANWLDGIICLQKRIQCRWQFCSWTLQIRAEETGWWCRVQCAGE